MKKILLATTILTLTYSLWSCSSSSKEDEKTTPKTLCDSVTYAAMVKPLLSKSCNQTGCHSSGAGGVDLRTYNTAREATENGKLISCIKHEASVPAMPQGAAKLSDREISIMECWKSKGFPQ
jgi:hypothetical protein